MIFLPPQETDPTGIMSPGEFSIHPTAIVYSILAWLSWLLCIAPLVWHLSQRNVAAGSLVLWIILTNFSLGINPILWPHDDLKEWWDGIVWCDVNVRVQIGAQGGLCASVAMILRRLARVMDTRKMTVVPSRNSRVKAQLVELAWCWGYPIVLILLYIPVQSVRYNIWGIEGCISAYRPSWKSLVFSAMWAPITMIVAVYYAALLLFRLYRYRSEFSRLVTARNTTKSRFIRLFTICIVLILIVMPYSVYAFYYFYSEMAKLKWDDNWEELHGDQRTAILKFPSNGQVHIDKWGQVVLGYIVFFVFGTGTDAHNTYKKILLFIGLGKIFPSLYNMRESGASTPSSFISARSWTSTCVSKAKTYFFEGSARMSSFGGSTFNNSVTNNSVALKSMDDTHPPSISSTTPVLRHGRHSSYSSLLKSMFTRSSRHQPVLPVFSQQSTTSSDHDVDKSVVETTSECFSAHAWATEVPQSRRNSEPVGVHIVHEVHVGGEMRQSEERKSADDWMLRP